MNKARKCITAVLTVCLTAGVCSACDYDYDEEYFTYDYLANKDRVVSIDLIDYTPNATYLTGGGVDTLHIDPIPFDASKVLVQEELPSEEIDAFLLEFSQKDVYRHELEELYSWTIDTPFGRSVRITYDDGSFDLISYGKFFTEDDPEYPTSVACYAEFDNSGNITYRGAISWGGWYSLVAANYFDTKIVSLVCNVTDKEV